jgi:hypothetical protein
MDETLLQFTNTPFVMLIMVINLSRSHRCSRRPRQSPFLSGRAIRGAAEQLRRQTRALASSTTKGLALRAGRRCPARDALYSGPDAMRRVRDAPRSTPDAVRRAARSVVTPRLSS